MPTAAAPLPIAPDDLAALRRWARASHLPAVLVQRAKILLLAAEGMASTEIADRVGVTRPTVTACRARYLQGGLDSLPGRPRSGRPRPSGGSAVRRSWRSPSTRPHRAWGSRTGRPGCWPPSWASAATPCVYPKVLSLSFNLSR
jgi:hypothetical protein